MLLSLGVKRVLVAVILSIRFHRSLLGSFFWLWLFNSRRFLGMIQVLCHISSLTWALCLQIHLPIHRPKNTESQKIPAAAWMLNYPLRIATCNECSFSQSSLVPLILWRGRWRGRRLGLGLSTFSPHSNPNPHPHLSSLYHWNVMQVSLCFVSGTPPPFLLMSLSPSHP